MTEPLETISVRIEHNEWDIEELRKKYIPCDFTYYYGLCSRSGDYSKFMFGEIVEKAGELFLVFKENDDMQEDIKLDSKLGREILAMSEM